MKDFNKDSKKLLLIDDDRNLILLVKDYLEFRGYEVMVAGNGREALEMLNQRIPDMIIWDVMMPEMDGYAFIDRIRRDPRTSWIPVMFLADKGQSQDKIRGLNTGADIYMIKPFEPEELVAQVESSLKRAGRLLRHSNRSFTEETNRIQIPSNVELTPTELKVLQFLAQGMANREIAERLNVSQRTIESHISNMLNKTNLYNRIDITKPRNEYEYETVNEYEYETVKVNRRGEIIEREKRRARYYREKIEEGIEIEMVHIEGGSFEMGAPPEEKGSYESERPQHQVNVESFYLGKYPITQRQWEAIARLEKVEIDLDPDPSRFKGENRPVELVNWYEAVEFCRRLSRETGKEYRLPREAQWEYACRAGTKSPFAYGETLTGELANYNAWGTYAEEARGEYRGETTPVGQYYANRWGLYDMHGNVWEWCEDEWHKNYEGVPEDGRAWKNVNPSQDEDLRFIQRGGSWGAAPVCCRSAFRYNYYGGRLRNTDYGFRVVCAEGGVTCRIKSPEVPRYTSQVEVLERERQKGVSSQIIAELIEIYLKTISP